MKKLLGIIALVAIAAVVGWNFSQNQNGVELSDLALENIDALANPENDPLHPGWENRICENDWVGGMGGSMNRVCKCWTPGSTYLFCN